MSISCGLFAGDELQAEFLIKLIKWVSFDLYSMEIGQDFDTDNEYKHKCEAAPFNHALITLL
jgi:hypothetical protein